MFFTGNQFGDVGSRFIMSKVKCTGKETSLGLCDHRMGYCSTNIAAGTFFLLLPGLPGNRQPR